MTVYQILCLIGVPSILTGIVGYFVKVIKGIIVDQQELKKGVQALLKAEMIRDYNDYSSKGYSFVITMIILLKDIHLSMPRKILKLCTRVIIHLAVMERCKSYTLTSLNYLLNQRLTNKRGTQNDFLLTT